MMRVLWLLVCTCTLACDARSRPEVPPDTLPPAAGDVAADTVWPEPGAAPIAIHRSRAVDFTGDGRAERVEVTAQGTRYDSLDITLTIRGADGDTLWLEEWQSIYYFMYDDIATHSPASVARIVQEHVDTLLADSRFSMSGGLPAPLRMSSTPMQDIMREAARYHLAELDWRRAAGLRPAQETPPDAHSVIADSTVTRERVDAVVAELAARPTFMYFAGGEATYAIAWSERERAFVRIHACC